MLVRNIHIDNLVKKIIVKEQPTWLNRVECVFFDNIVINDDVLQQSLLRHLNDVILSWALFINSQITKLSVNYLFFLLQTLK